MDMSAGISAYEQALELRPNYVRTLTNVGLGFNNIRRFDEAVPYFLNALQFNPKATHIWDYVRRSFMNMNRFDLLERCNLRDPNAFRQDFKLMDPKNLPQPSMEKLYNNPLLNGA